MKTFLLIFSIIIFFSCNKSIEIDNPMEMDIEHIRLHEEMDKISVEYDKFQKVLVSLYKESEKNPELVIQKADSLLKVNENENDKYKSQIKNNVRHSLYYLKS